MGVVRLKKRAQFLGVSQLRKAFHTPYFIVQYLFRQDLEQRLPLRVGFTVSRKVGNAVVRNRVRRRLREVVRLTSLENPEILNQTLDLVLIGRRASFDASFSQMKEAFSHSLQSILKTNYSKE